jgi:CHAD domain-containing protein
MPYRYKIVFICLKIRPTVLLPEPASMPTPQEKTRPTERDDIAEINPSMRASIAVATILTGFHRALNAQEEGVIVNRDPEFLHDFRVALRTSRSVLTGTQGVFPKRCFRRFRSYLGWLARISSAPRDLDVFLLALEDYRLRLSKAQWVHLSPLCDLLREQQGNEHLRLAETLNSPYHLHLKHEYQDFLSLRSTEGSRTVIGQRPVLEAANRSIWRAYRKVVHQGRAIAPDSPLDPMHELRKWSKKLRYLLQAFEPLYPHEQIQAIVDALKRFQDHLGIVVDLNVQHQWLTTWRQAMEHNELVPPETSQAIQALDQLLADGERKPRACFAADFDAFDRRAVRKSFKKLFRPSS